MKLSKWLTQNQIDPATFAQQAGVRRQTIYRYLSGKRVPRPAIMVRIERLTEGDVRVADWFSDLRFAA